MPGDDFVPRESKGECVKVVVRVRPLSDKEVKKGSKKKRVAKVAAMSSQKEAAVLAQHATALFVKLEHREFRPKHSRSRWLEWRLFESGQLLHVPLELTNGGVLHLSRQARVDGPLVIRARVNYMLPAPLGRFRVRRAAM